MICNECNEEITDTSKFCPNCGNKVPNGLEQTGNKRSNKVSYRVPILICFIIIILIIGGIGGYKYYKNYCIVKSQTEGIKLLKEKNYSNALDKFNEILIKNNNNQEIINLKDLTKNCITLIDDYNNNNFSGVITDYDKVKTNPSFSIVNVDINEMYNDAIKRPNINLKYVVYDSDEYINNKYYENENGELVLRSINKSDIDSDAFMIDFARPSSEVNFQIENTGINPAEELVLNLKFNNMAIEFESTNPKWQGVSNLHGIGLWNEIKFAPKGELLYRDSPIKFTFSFANAMVYSNANIEVTLLSKSSASKKFTIPVKVKQY